MSKKKTEEVKQKKIKDLIIEDIRSNDARADFFLNWNIEEFMFAFLYIIDEKKLRALRDSENGDLKFQLIAAPLVSFLLETNADEIEKFRKKQGISDEETASDLVGKFLGAMAAFNLNLQFDTIDNMEISFGGDADEQRKE